MKYFIKKHQEKISLIVFLTVVCNCLSFPLPILANVDPVSLEERLRSNKELYYKALTSSEDVGEETNAIGNIGNNGYALTDNTAKLPQNQTIQAKKTKFKKITAYTSEVAQCDASPCITASGFNVCQHGVEDTVAANFLPLGSKIRMPDLFGDRIFVVRDRTSTKYADRIDVWMKSKKAAINFGIKNTRVEILNQQ